MQESLDERRRSIFHRINTFRGGGVGSAGAEPVVPSMLKAGDHKRKAGALPPNFPNSNNVKRRMEQWKRIEEEALRQQQICSDQNVDNSEVS